jgi:hypothetical protein
VQVASSSRSQLAMPTNWDALRLTWEAQSISVHWSLSLAEAIVTHLVTRSPHLLELAWSLCLLIRRSSRQDVGEPWTACP